MKTALLIGQDPGCTLGYTYVNQGEYEAVVIGSLSLGQLLRFRDERVLSALSHGKTVLLYTPGLPVAPHNRALAASIAGATRELKSWGVVFTDGAHKHLVTAQEARELRAKGEKPAPGAVLTPLAREVLEGTQ